MRRCRKGRKTACRREADRARPAGFDLVAGASERLSVSAADHLRIAPARRGLLRAAQMQAVVALASSGESEGEAIRSPQQGAMGPVPDRFVASRTPRQKRDN